MCWQIACEFAELDVDHDGYITPEDLVAASRGQPTTADNTIISEAQQPAATSDDAQSAEKDDAGVNVLGVS